MLLVLHRYCTTFNDNYYFIVEQVRYENELRSLSENHPVSYHLDLPHLSDTFVGFSTTPRHIAYVGEDTTGSIYLQSMAKYLDQYKHELPFDRIYLMVKQEMAQTRQGSKAIIQGADESNRLLKLLYFTEKQPQVL